MNTQLALKALSSRNKYIRELGKAMLGRENKLKETPRGILMPSQLELISEISQTFNIEEYLNGPTN